MSHSLILSVLDPCYIRTEHGVQLPKKTFNRLEPHRSRFPTGNGEVLFALSRLKGLKVSVEKQYVEQREQGYWIADSRVSLESVVFAFLDGLSPETIAAECFPVLTLEQVCGAIAYYLGNRREVDAYLRQADFEFEQFQQATRDPEFSRKMAKARRQIQSATP